MATSYSVVPTSEAGVVEWLSERGIELPGNWNQSRYPSPAEIRVAMDRMANYQVEYFITQQEWQATISQVEDPKGPIWALLIVLGYAGDESVPHNFCFERGAANVMRDVLDKLAAVCGPLLLVNNSDLTDTKVLTGSASSH